MSSPNNWLIPEIQDWFNIRKSMYFIIVTEKKNLEWHNYDGKSKSRLDYVWNLVQVQNPFFEMFGASHVSEFRVFSNIL